ncbi:MAG: hypothetical protein HY078_08210 [Elusimicrobia bacterium]|nr:hypothetical protein [Elusimicrobiota bacterium]
MSAILSAVLILLSLGARASAAALPWAATPLDEALSAELARATTGMQLEGYPPPYYVALRVSDNQFEEFRCSMGAVRYSEARSLRLLTSDVHVGSHELDNHSMVPSAGYSAVELPLDGDVFAIRHRIWEALDGRYKAAAADFLRKQAVRVRRGKADYDTDDWTRETPMTKDFQGPAQSGRGGDAAKSLCSGLSGLFRTQPSAIDPRVTVEISSNWKRFFDSEGARVRYGSSVVRLEMNAHARTPDGMRVQAVRSFMGQKLGDLPDRATLEAAVRELEADLTALRVASSTSPFSAPALIDPSVGAAVVQAFATRLSGDQQRNPEGAQTFRDMIGRRVLPAFLTLADDPTQVSFRGTRLAGQYQVDEQGVRAQRVTLVENGVLRNYLLSRYPIVGFSKSNGHGRAAAGREVKGRATNLFLDSNAVLSKERLLERLLQECRLQGKPYGLWIQKSRAWRQQDTTSQQQAFRLLPTLVYLVDAKTGAMTLVRDLDMVGTPLDLLGKIIEVGDDPKASHSFVEDASGTLVVSAVSPTLLLKEVELQRADTKPERLPVLPPPTP